MDGAPEGFGHSSGGHLGACRCGLCFGAGSGIPCFSAEGGNRGGRGAECGCLCAAEAGDRGGERVQQRTVELTPAPQILEEAVEVVKLVPRERVQPRIDEHMVELPIPQIV